MVLKIEIKHLMGLFEGLGRKSISLQELNSNEVKDLQRALLVLGYPVGSLDGWIGNKTSNAWAEFKEDEYQGNPNLLGMGSLGLLSSKLKEIGDRLESYDLHNFTLAKKREAIKNECIAQGIGLRSQIAYVLATVQHETANTFKPVREGLRASDAWRKKNLWYYPWHGRGDVQLTHEFNYALYGAMLGVDLVGNPDLALDPEISLFVLVHGFKTGRFTGRKITDYINSNRKDFVNCRRCINGTDKQHLIAGIAARYYAA